jgi:Bacterial RNA polymerase, alpha chain C terminal domain
MQTYSDFFKTLHDETSPTGFLGRGTHYSVLRAVVFHDLMGKPLTKGQFADFAVIWDEDHDIRVMDPIEEIYRRGLLLSFLIFGERKGTFTAILADEFQFLDLEINPAFLKRVEDLELSSRSINSLRTENIVYIGDLVQRSEAEMFRIQHLGRKSLDEITEALSQMGLALGVEVPGWPPKNIEELISDTARLKFLETEIDTICQSLDDPWPSEVVAIGSEENPIIDDDDEKVTLYLKTLEMLWQLGIRVKQPKEPAPLAAKPPRRVFDILKRPANADGTPPGWTADPSEADRDPAFE